MYWRWREPFRLNECFRQLALYGPAVAEKVLPAVTAVLELWGAYCHESHFHLEDVQYMRPGLQAYV